jgi:signal transduction histidine kinase
MNFYTPISIFHLFVAAAYLVILVLVLRKRGFSDFVSRLLGSLLALAILFEVGLSLQRFLFYSLGIPVGIVLHLPYYGLLLLSFLFLILSTTFLRNKAPHWGWWLLAPVWLILVLSLDFNWFSLPYTLWQSGIVLIDLADISFVALVLGWGVCSAFSARVIVQVYRQTERIVVRHRITYWTLGFLLTFLGGVFYLVLIYVVGSIFLALGAATAYYLITVHRLPDLRTTIRRVISGLLVGLLELVIYTAGFWVIQNYFGRFAVYNLLLPGVILAFSLLILLNPLLQSIQKWVNKSIFGSAHDPNRIFREYSQSVSNILDLNLLSTVAVGLISDALEVQSGALFTVDSEYGDDGVRRYRLKGIPGTEKSAPINAKIPLDSPIAKKLGDERSPLMQSEIDVLPEFRFLTAQERSWLSSQEMDVYVPIHAKDEWVGIFALGPKSSGASYFDDDLDLLATLANQTAVALQNARLVGSLVRINNEFRRAYSSMQEAHAKLERIDRTKSDFISIASHELRTPLTVLSGYSQMLMDDSTFSENAYYAKVIAGIYDGTSRLHEIVDSMLDVAKIDTRALELQSEPVQLHIVLESICQGFSKAFQERNLILDLDEFSELPAVQGDPEALKKVFSHLIMNAIKYTPDGGKISISGFDVESGNKRYPPGGVEVVISDTGIGIDPRFKDLIFTKFYQTGELALHSSGKTKFKGGGPGLGLAIVRGIVQAHGGRVWADSPGYDEEKNPGSHFHVILPINAEGRVTPPGEISV